MGEKTIPILPCPSIPDVVGFYQALGFEVTHLQTRPNPYASLRYGGGIPRIGQLKDTSYGPPRARGSSIMRCSGSPRPRPPSAYAPSSCAPTSPTS